MLTRLLIKELWIFRFYRPNLLMLLTEKADKVYTATITVSYLTTTSTKKIQIKSTRDY